MKLVSLILLLFSGNLLAQEPGLWEHINVPFKKYRYKLKDYNKRYLDSVFSFTDSVFKKNPDKEYYFKVDPYYCENEKEIISFFRYKEIRKAVFDRYGGMPVFYEHSQFSLFKEECEWGFIGMKVTIAEFGY